MDMNFEQFRKIYPARKPDATKIKNSDELILIPSNQGIMFFPDKILELSFSKPPEVMGDRGNTYLWVIALDSVPFALEALPFGANLETKVIKHTNLTGGNLAHCGGELWFLSSSEIVLSGCSGRYGPKTAEELDYAALSFKSCGYSVASLGYDEETGYPSAILVGQLKWH